MKNRLRGQAAIEMTIAIIGSLVLIAGSLKICLWMARTIVERQEAYQATRTAAGRNSNGRRGCLKYYEPGKLSVFGEFNEPGQRFPCR